MDLELAGKKILVTGGSKGIGLAVARAFAREGCNLVMVSRHLAEINEIARGVAHTFGVKAQAIAADLSEQSEIERVAQQCVDCDILINNAGAIPPGTLPEISMADWKRSWDLKVFGYMAMSQACYPALAARKGVIVSVIGAAGSHPNPSYIAGSSGNAALMAFTKALAKTAREDGVRVLGVNPGPVATERFQMFLKAEASRQFGNPELWQDLLVSMPFGRAARVEEIADTVVFLASARSGYTSGTVLPIDGAMT
jgi:NAD(P)-dependent dehydrogenase (short-subunit alcohol dehydrogenase family)